MKTFDVIVIGAGVVGNAIARELTRYRLNVAVLEKELDTGFETSGRNSGVLHAGFNNRPGTLMAKLCVKGNRGFEREAALLGIDFRRTGKLVTGVTEEDRSELIRLRGQGEANGAEGLSILTGDEIRKIHPRIGGNWALLSECTGVFDPFEYTVALGEHACQNGAVYFFGKKVSEIRRGTFQADDCGGPDSGCMRRGQPGGGVERNSAVDCFQVTAGGESFRCRWLVNSGGLYADEICRLAGIDKYEIRPCRGEYHILDKSCGLDLPLPVYPVPNPKAGGLGIHLTPSIHGNIMIGPSAEYLGENEKEEYDSTRDVMDMLFEGGHQLLADIKRSDIIRSFAGIRPKLTSKETGGYADFIIRQEADAGRFITLAGIESPGLTASIPIGRMVAEIIRQQENLERNPSYRERRDYGGTEEDNIDVASGAQAGRTGQAEESRGRILCRCETVTKGQILDAYDDIVKIGALPTLRGIKNRTRAGMGRCQGGFCSVKIVELLTEERGVDPLTFCWDKSSGRMFAGRAR